MRILDINGNVINFGLSDPDVQALYPEGMYLHGYLVDQETGEGLSPGTLEQITIEPETTFEANLLRAKEVAKIVVTLASGIQLDGNEKSQERMSRAISALNEGETIAWVGADNQVHNLTSVDLTEALRLAGDAQSAIWAKYVVIKSGM